MTTLDDTEKCMHAMVTETLRGWRECDAARELLTAELASLKQTLAEVAEDRDRKYRDAMQANRQVLELIEDRALLEANVATERADNRRKDERIAALEAQLNERVDAYGPTMNEEAAE